MYLVFMLVVGIGAGVSVTGGIDATSEQLTRAGLCALFLGVGAFIGALCERFQRWTDEASVPDVVSSPPLQEDDEDVAVLRRLYRVRERNAPRN